MCLFPQCFLNYWNIVPLCAIIQSSVSTEDWGTFPLGTLKSTDVQVLYKDSISLVYNLGASLYRPYFVPFFFFEISVLLWSPLPPSISQCFKKRHSLSLTICRLTTSCQSPGFIYLILYTVGTHYIAQATSDSREIIPVYPGHSLHIM